LTIVCIEFSQPHRHLSSANQDRAGAIVVLPHPPIFHNRLSKLFDFSRTKLLLGR
jgi:hypothetical protein